MCVPFRLYTPTLCTHANMLVRLPLYRTCRHTQAFRYTALTRCFSSTRNNRRFLIEELRQRGLVNTTTSPQLDHVLQNEHIKLYCGVDPTAASLHLGNLLTLMVLLHFHIRGHGAIALVGGATGRVGDPAGKSSQRDVIAQEIIADNVVKIKTQLQTFLDRGSEYAKSVNPELPVPGSSQVVNNAEWYDGLTFMEFMQTVGRNVRVQHMLNRDSVKNRISNAAGMSFGEFTYQLLQAYDFWCLHRDRGVRLQIGGSDQYGNITAGIDLVGRMQQQEQTKVQEVFGLTIPLLTTPTGEKFGKSAGNAIWLDPSMTSPFDLYQFFVKTPDSQVPIYLKLFSLLPLEEIDRLAVQHAEAPEKRVVHHILAREMLTLIHGKQRADQVSLATRLLFPADFADSGTASPTAKQIVEAFEGDGRLVKLPSKDVIGNTVAAILRATGSAESGKKAQALIAGGAVTRGLDAIKISSHKEAITGDWLLEDRLLVLRIGKSKFVLVQAI
ncbi:tyrosine-tRNA ligase [Protomyces lactucae-debilis]|uniref:Tyrosine--tRNA ligase n=1 Tax=Protomyces lactucae-debilis TaxID=2754530 RepID=A0A1Y2FBR7_PROLT|nr:tyrosine-tRNA ligase [Protomyces lactucae-debilis]ORY81360.1 tyrosine-tRNA ligase [Protomyces lactucae-debilis]